MEYRQLTREEAELLHTMHFPVEARYCCIADWRGKEPDRYHCTDWRLLSCSEAVLTPTPGYHDEFRVTEEG